MNHYLSKTKNKIKLGKMDIKLFPPGGWIYIIMTASDYDRVKIGKSRNAPMVRTNNLKTGDPNIALGYVYFVPDTVVDFSILEKLIHQALDDTRVPFMETGGKSEWFYGYISDVRILVDDIIEGFEYPLYRGISPFDNVISVMSIDDLLDYLKPPLQLDEDGFPIF